MLRPQTQSRRQDPVQRSTIGIPTALACVVMGAMAIGVSPVFVREAEVGPMTSAFWRVTLAIPFLVIWARQEASDRTTWQNGMRSRPIILAGLFFAGDLIFWHLAIMHTSLANAALFACLAPVWVSLFSNTFLGERVPLNAIVGLVLCLCGAILLLGASFLLAPENLWGDLCGIVTSMFFGLYFLAIRAARRTYASGLITLNSTLITAILLFFVAVFTGGSFLPETSKGYWALLSLGLVSHAGGQGLLTVALGVLSAVFSSLVIFMEALAAAFFGWLVYDENLSLGQTGGAVLILYGIWHARPR